MMLALPRRSRRNSSNAKLVDASSISVETLKGEVMLSGFAKSSQEKTEAERIARSVKGVKSVKNEIAVRS
ncbi:MAG: BON domain-containing protein [Propionivibrio sp.]